jgi:hypothetical protein
MTLSIEFPDVPDVPDVPDELALYATQPAGWSRDAVAQLGRRLRLSGEVADRGLWYVVDDGRAALEVYQASQSFRFARRQQDGETAGAAGGPADETRSRAVADRWVEAFAPAGASFGVHSVDEQEVLVAERGVEEPRRLVSGLQVSYGFTLGGVALLGPGAKMQVGVDPAGGISGAYRFWREPRAAGATRTVRPEEAFDRFSRSELFADLSDRSAQAEVGAVRLGYLCLPPTEPQGLLVPAYELRGALATGLQPRYEFVSYVAAADVAGGRDRWAQVRSGLVTA